jgi:hypothetical protein
VREYRERESERDAAGTVSSAKPTVVFRLSMKSCDERTSRY